MKKVLFTIITIFAFLMPLKAQEYSCNITADDSMHPYDETKSDEFNSTDMKIDINNLSNISSFKMFIDYDSNLYTTKECKFLNNTVKCKTVSEEEPNIYYKYSYSSSNKIDDYDFFTVTFISNEDTPDSGTSEVKVYFENVKDKDGNEIIIEPCGKVFTFKDYDYYVVPSENKDTPDTTKVSSNYIKSIKIKGFEFDFDKETQEYNLKVPNEINKLDIEVVLEDENSKYSVTGASDLNSFGNKVIITVTNTSNEDRVYTIDVLREKEEIKTTDVKAEIKGIFKNPLFRKYLPFALGALIILLVIVMIVRKSGSRKMDKYLDNL